MSDNVTDRLTPDGERLKRELEELSKLEVRVGFQQGEATTDDGIDMCDIAMWNEMGTLRSPSRPFMRDAVDNHEAEINNFCKSQQNNIINSTAEQVLKLTGIFLKDLIQNEIVDGNFAPNAPYTIAKKGSDKPLIDTGRMRQSVNYVIKPKGS